MPKQETKYYNYYGIAVKEERPGTDYWGHKEGESCVHLKFGAPFKYAHFEDDFIAKHKEFYTRYMKAFSTNHDTPRDEMLYIWREIINLNQSGELVVILNMCDLEVAGPESIAFYAIQQDSHNNWTWNELTAE